MENKLKLSIKEVINIIVEHTTLTFEEILNMEYDVVYNLFQTVQKTRAQDLMLKRAILLAQTHIKK